MLLNLTLEDHRGVQGRNNKLVSKEEDMEINEKLKILNKPPMKSIKMKLGDMYDCINIYKQPAFDHPLLRNHKIQMKPNVIQGEQIEESTSNMVSSDVRYKLKGCPSETVPIRRTTKEELVNAKHLSNWIKRRHVHPQLFGDNKTRVFGLWTADGFKETGCYNMLCPGFVQVHPEYSFGEELTVGRYGGNQRVFDFSVHRDPESGNWWFINGIDNAKIGYWPKEIFTHLSKHASVIGYGGVAGAGLSEPTPPMGYGYSPTINSTYTCFMAGMKVVDDRGRYLNFDTSKVQLDHDTERRCYDIIFPGWYISHGIMMFFGGPGGYCP
ncbi:uncharacterized protein LOC113344547 isoform X2 [Papaver somniferum]|uniref:uncharacterized protein LOC113344547 isoform X2 n=1 Tax=Papaver somniferum TaxID=3469 RepID=UPI000E6F8122|nr:uncharacterized protein LOC113344547 isoform X2 [Papaver somniferum]